MISPMSKEIKVRDTPPKARTTINLPNNAHTKLSRITLKMNARGSSRWYKQTLAASMISYFDAHPERLKELVFVAA